jgi:hypothetical protein
MLVRPWAEMPLNDDWQYAHFAKSFAENGRFAADVPVAPTVVGQSLIAWPVIKIFGFSHVALRTLTMVISVMMLFAVDYLLIAGGVAAGIRLIALCSIVANPLFLHLSTTFMTENYGYLIALLSACIWFRGRKTDSTSWYVASAAVAGASFWIRQFCALVFPALILAEWIAGGAKFQNVRTLLVKRSLPMLVWVLIVGLYFPWAKATGNYSPHFSEALGHAFAPNPVAMLLEAGVFLFYMSVILIPFLVAYGIPRRPTVAGSIVLCALTLTAAFAWLGGVNNGPPSASLKSTFPFLSNVVTSYGVGPITLTDVYWENAQRPHISAIPWLLLEAIALILSLAWGSVASRLRENKNEVALFGMMFSLLSLIAVLVSYRYDVFDRYHYSGILGLTIALAILLPKSSESRLRRVGIIWIALLAVFSTLGVHDYFRWQEARAQLLAQAQSRGIAVSQIDAGFEPNGWNTVDGNAGSPGCGAEVAWFCRDRLYRIGLEQRSSERLLVTQRTTAWLAAFPDLKLLERK